MKRIAILIGALMVMIGMLAGTMSALAQPVRNADGQFSITASTLEDGSTVNLTTDTVQLVGKDESGAYLIYADEQLLKADASGLAGLINYVDTSAIKSVVELEDMARGARGEEVIAVQQGLQKLGYLYGSADGDFGAGTERAVIAFQTAMGFEANGVLTGVQQLLLASMGAEETVIDSSMDPKARFAVIADKVSANMDPLYNSNYTMDYDAFEGKGFISNGNEITCDASGAADIDQAVFTITYGFEVKEEAGAVTLTPVIKASCLCTRRPVMQSLAIRIDDNRTSLPAGALENGLSGARSIETVAFTLDADAVRLLGEGNELQMRIEAKYQNYDISLSAEQVKGIRDFCELAAQL